MRDERTLKMIKNYVKDFDNGLKPSQIAKKYKLSTWTIYNCLDEIAKKAGRTRESLLKHPHDEHVMSGRRNYELVERIDMVDFNDQIKRLSHELSLIKKSIDREIKRIEDSLAEMKKEEDDWKEISR